MKTRTIIIWILILIIIDQGIKIIIFNFHTEVTFEIIPTLLEFKPKFNINHSWVNSLLNKNFGINVGVLPHLILYVMIGLFVPMYFSFFRNKVSCNKKLIDTSTIFIMATVLCALIGNTIWKNGTLDFIYLKPLFIFDLKDVYSDVGIVIFLAYALKNRKELDQSMKGVKTRDLYKEMKIRHTEWKH